LREAYREDDREGVPKDDREGVMRLIKAACVLLVRGRIGEEIGSASPG
jgi:hypothetical protein